jgi:hypothetical protein
VSPSVNVRPATPPCVGRRDGGARGTQPHAAACAPAVAPDVRLVQLEVPGQSLFTFRIPAAVVPWRDCIRRDLQRAVNQYAVVRSDAPRVLVFPHPFEHVRVPEGACLSPGQIVDVMGAQFDIEEGA